MSPSKKQDTVNWYGLGDQTSSSPSSSDTDSTTGDHSQSHSSDFQTSPTLEEQARGAADINRDDQSRNGDQSYFSSTSTRPLSGSQGQQPPSEREANYSSGRDLDNPATMSYQTDFWLNDPVSPVRHEVARLSDPEALHPTGINDSDITVAKTNGNGTIAGGKD